MAGKNTAVFGIYSTYALTEGAVNALREAGFRNTDVSVLFPENAGTKDFAHEKGTKAPEGHLVSCINPTMERTSECYRLKKTTKARKS